MNWWGKIISSKRNIAIGVAIVLVLLASGLAVAKGSFFKIFADTTIQRNIHVIDMANGGYSGLAYHYTIQ